MGGGGVRTLTVAPPTDVGYKVWPVGVPTFSPRGHGNGVTMSSPNSSVVLGYWDIRGVSEVSAAELLSQKRLRQKRLEAQGHWSPKERAFPPSQAATLRDQPPRAPARSLRFRGRLPRHPAERD